MINHLPQLWTTAKISELCDVLKDKGRASLTPYLEIGNVSIVSKNYTLTRKPSVKGCRIARWHDVLISKVRPTRGAITYVREEELYISSAFTVLRNKGAMAEKYLWMFLAWNHNYLNHLGENCTGTMYPTTSDEVIVNFEVPLAPLSEQRRIVAKLEKLLAKVEACQERLNIIPRHLKRFRQSVLAAACTGRLTADWRVQNNITDEFEQTTVEAIADYVGGFAFKSPTFLETGRNQVIRIGNVRPLSLKLDAAPVFIPDDIVEQTQRFRLLPDDIAISMTGTKYKQDYGYAALVVEYDGSLFLNQRVARLRCSDLVLPKFLLFWLQTEAFRDFFFSGETGNVNQGNVGADGIRKAPIALPSLAEQREIIRRVEALFKIADWIEARYQKAKEYVDKLTQSILAKAFRGELAPQDPNDEPADKLLRRIAENRETSLSHGKSTGKKKRS